MALPNSPFSGINHGPSGQVARPTRGEQLQVSTVRRVIGNNVHSGFSMPHGAGFLSTNLISRQGQTIAVHNLLYRGKIVHISIPVKTVIHKGGTMTPVKLQPQTVKGF